MKKSIIITTFLSSFILLFSACQIDVPVKEMTEARHSIEEAKKLKAEKYAPKELKEAEELLYKSHTSCAKEDVKNCKKEALLSHAASQKAIEKTLPLLAADTLKEARKEHEELEALNAENYAPELYAKAGSSLKDSAAAEGQQNYLQSYTSASASLTWSQKTKELCLAKVPELRQQIETLKISLQDIRKKKPNSELTAQIDEIEKSLLTAEKAISANRLSEASSLITTTSIKVKEVQAALVKSNYQDKINGLRTESANLANARGSEFAPDELKELQVLLDESDILLEKNSFESLDEKLAKGTQLLDLAKEKTGRGIAVEKLETVKNLYAKIEKEKQGQTYDEKLKEAGDLISSSSTLLEENSFNDSLQKSIEAETLLNSITVEREKALSLKSREGDKESSDISGSQVYIVKYRKKDKDCLWRISQKVYRDARLWPRIYVANKDRIKDPDLIFPGQRFIIPPLTKKNERVPADDSQKKNPKEGEIKPDTDKKAGS